MGGIGSKVVELREKLAMSQKDLAHAASMPQATVSRIERGLIAQPRVDILRKLAEALHVTVDYLTGRSSEMSSSDVVRSDPRAEAIFRDYKELTDEEQAQLLTFVRFLRSNRARPQGGK